VGKVGDGQEWRRRRGLDWDLIDCGFSASPRHGRGFLLWSGRVAAELLREGVRLVVWEGESKAVRWCLLFGPGGPCGGAVWRRSSAVASAMAPLEAATHTPKAQESEIYIYVQSMTFVIRAFEKPSQF